MRQIKGVADDVVRCSISQIKNFDCGLKKKLDDLDSEGKNDCDFGPFVCRCDDRESGCFPRLRPRDPKCDRGVANCRNVDCYGHRPADAKRRGHRKYNQSRQKSVQQIREGDKEPNHPKYALPVGAVMFARGLGIMIGDRERQARDAERQSENEEEYQDQTN